MKNDKKPDAVPTEPAKHEEEFSAHGWVREVENWFDRDNPTAILSYLDRAVEPLLFHEDTKHHAAELLREISAFQELDAAYKADGSDQNYRKALVAMFTLGACAKSLEEERHFPSNRKLKALQRDIDQHTRFIQMREANRDRDVGRAVVNSIACDYARLRWSEDKEQKLRTSDMAEIVWAWMAEHERLLEYRPSDIAGLKKWLRPVAAEFPHANKPGRTAKR